MSKVGILGSGAWGTAIACSLARRGGHTITLWSHRPVVAEVIRATCENSVYLPGFTLPSSIMATSDLREAIADAEIIVGVMPSRHVREVYEHAAPYLHAGQVLVYQVPIPEPLRFLEPRETETRRMHALGEYGLMHVKLYEDIARFGHIATSYAYPVKVNARYVMDPSPTPKFDNPKMDDCPALQLFGAGREKRIYAIPPHTNVVSLDFEDHPFTRYRFDAPCALCGAEDSYLDEIVTDDQGSRMFVCSDTDYCEGRQASGHRGSESAAPHKERAHG